MTSDKENEAPQQVNAKPKAKQTAKASPKNATKKRKSAEADDSGSKDQDQSKTSSTAKKAKTATTSKAKDEKDALPDVSEIQIPGVMEDEAPVYATGTDIRRMLNNKLKETGATQVKFCKMANKASGKNINPRQLATFRDKAKKRSGGGACLEGTDSPVFYAAWCYFEKLRMKEGKAKSKHQLEMEEAHGSKGVPRLGNKPMLQMPGEKLWFDKYGRLVVQTPEGKVIAPEPSMGLKY